MDGYVFMSISIPVFDNLWLEVASIHYNVVNSSLKLT